MKKFIFILSLLPCLGLPLIAQDLIITTEGDTLNCKITKQKKDFVYFIYKQKDKIHNTMLSSQKISQIERNYFTQSEVPHTVYTSNAERKNSYRITIDGGWAHRLGKLPEASSSETNDYLKKLKNGGNIGLSAQYFWNKSFGVGLEYSLFKTSYSSDNMHIPNVGTGYIKDNIFIHFTGATFNICVPSKHNNNALFMAIGFGYLGYKDKGTIKTESLNITGSTVGALYSLGYDFGLSSKMSLGIKLSLIAGTLDKIKYSSGPYSKTMELEDDERESLSQLNISIGLRFRGK